MDRESLLIEGMISDIISYGLYDEVVFDAMRNIKRSIFAQSYPVEVVYRDRPLDIGYGQTISQPFTVAFMLHELQLKKGMSVLEIGSGSGWVIALIKEIVGDGVVVGVEIEPHLAAESRERLRELDIDAEIISGDGSIGCRAKAPFDRILVSAACPSIPKKLYSQLKAGGCIVAPVGKDVQVMVRATFNKQGIDLEKLGEFRFVPLRGRFGFQR